MKPKLKFTDIFGSRETHKTIIKVGIALLLAMELFIYLGALVHSGSQSWVMVYDNKGDKIYESPGNIMTRYERRIFENAYGPLDQYRVETEIKDTPFPFRAWLAIAVGAPIGLALLLVYLLRVYMTFLSGEETESLEEANGSSANTSAFSGRWFALSRFSIFHIGFLLVLCLLAVWLIPDYVAGAARGLMNAAIRFKWFFLAICVFLASLVVWIIYLRYRMSQRMMERNMDLEKFRVEKEVMLEMKKTETAALPDYTHVEDTKNEPIQRPAAKPQDIAGEQNPLPEKND